VLELTFYGGVRQIGGTKILLRSNGGSVFIDFGKDFGLEAAYFEEPWNPPFHIPSLLRIGALPDIPGLYRMNPGRPVDGVLVSHAHIDHCGYVPLLSPQIPVYAGEDTKNLILIRSETYDRDWTNDYRPTRWRTFRTGDVVKIEGTDFSFMPIHVDHSVPASYGFIIQTGGKKIAYTGDLRMHGRHPEMTRDFLRALKMNNIDTLICEGTHVAPEGGDPEAELLEHMDRIFRQRMGEAAPHRITVPCRTEDDVTAALKQIVASARGLVLVEVAPFDLDRVFAVWQAARAAGRTFTVPARLAHTILQARRRTKIEDLPEANRETALYLSQIKKHTSRCRLGDPLDAEELDVGRRQWEQRLAHDWTRQGGLLFALPMGREAIRENCGGFLICSPQVVNLLPELCYGADPCPVTFILSRIGPFNPEMAVSFDRLMHWLALYGCREYYHVHVSGHVSMEDIPRIIEAASPNRVMPVHTEHPEMFTQWHDHVLSEIEGGEPIALG
jgi:ribonuclease J